MRKRIVALTVAAVLAGPVLAQPASAHAGHASCGEGARAFIVPQAQAGLGGVVASGQAKEGLLDESVAAGHAALCDPKP